MLEGGADGDVGGRGMGRGLPIRGGVSSEVSHKLFHS